MACQHPRALVPGDRLGAAAVWEIPTSQIDRTIPSCVKDVMLLRATPPRRERSIGTDAPLTAGNVPPRVISAIPIGVARIAAGTAPPCSEVLSAGHLGIHIAKAHDARAVPRNPKRELAVACTHSHCPSRRAPGTSRSRPYPPSALRSSAAPIYRLVLLTREVADGVPDRRRGPNRTSAATDGGRPLITPDPSPAAPRRR